MNLELLKQILIVSIAASIVSTATIQKIKEQLKSKKWLFFISLVISIGIGIFFTLTFTELNILNTNVLGVPELSVLKMLSPSNEPLLFV